MSLTSSSMSPSCWRLSIFSENFVCPGRTEVCWPWFFLTAIGLLLVTNDVVKAFVWSPHNQMFNIFVPVFTLYAAMRANAGALLQRRFAILLGVGTGLGALAYPFFVIVLPCVAICAFVHARHRNFWEIWPRLAVNFILLTVLTGLPEALWAAFVMFKTGGFYQHEMVKYRQIVWILDAWQSGFGTVVQMWLAKLDDYLKFAVAQAVPILAVSILVGALLFANRNATRGAQPPPWPLVATGASRNGDIGFLLRYRRDDRGPACLYRDSHADRCGGGCRSCCNG